MIEVDHAIGYLLQRLEETELLQKINLIIVSDHGNNKSLHTLRNLILTY